MKKNRFLTIMLSMILVLSATGFSQSKITVKGSDTMVILAQKWAELYMKSNPSTVIQVTGGGSGVGITALINGTTDICNASRPGNDAEIRLYGRENSSGTYTYFHDEVVNGDYAASVQTLPGTAAVVNAVKKDVNGIGYGGAAYAQGVKHAKVKKDDKSPAILPTPESIGKGEYPITRFLYMYLRNRPTGDTKKYVDWILSAEGQMIVTEVGYFPYK
ncbi:MAG: substrate-binding domain-containing protein [Bacteroidales bacterium]|nr:substrate-binding domain-containing protein [Bacteroidales bacterium]